MVDKWGSYVNNWSGGGSLRIGATIVPYVYSDHIDFYLGIDIQTTYSVTDNSNVWAVSGDWTRAAATVSGGISIGSGGGTQSLWSEAPSSNHLYRVYGSPGQTITASVSAYIDQVWELNNKASVSYSESATIPAVVPSAPATVTSTPYNGYISVSYTAPTSDGGSAITSYQYSTDEVNWTTTPSNPFNVSGTNGASITVWVRAVNAVGAGPSNKTSNTPRTVPSAPQNLTANTATFGQITLSWTAPASNGGAAIDAYYVRTGTVVGSGTLLYSGTNTSYTQTGVSASTTYSYNVVAHNVAGSGAGATISTTSLGGVVNVYNGGFPSKSLPKVWNGSSWVSANARVWNGSSWVYTK